MQQMQDGPQATSATSAGRRWLPSPQEIEAACTGPGGWKRAQLAEWGVPWPPPKGWRKELEAEYALEQQEDEHRYAASYHLGIAVQLAHGGNAPNRREYDGLIGELERMRDEALGLAHE